MDSRRPTKAEQVIALLTALLTLAAVAWQLIPQHERQLMGLRLMRSVQSLLAGAAAAQGHEGMNSELRGRRGEAARFYGMAARLGTWRDELGAAMERLRA